MNNPVPRQDSAPSEWCFYVLAGETTEERLARRAQIPAAIYDEVIGMVITNHYRITGRKDDAF